MTLEATTATSQQQRRWHKSMPAPGATIAEPCDGLCARTEAGGDGLFESAPPLQATEDSELFFFEPAEIDGVLQAMNSKIDGSRLKARDSGNFLALLALVEGIAGNVGADVVLNGQK